MERSRTWCFTLNNYTEEEEDIINSYETNDQVRYLIYGREKGEEGTPHLQGYIMFYNPKNFKQVKKFLGDRCHIEKSKGTIQQNIAYCSKDDDFIEFGDKPKMGARKDIEDVKKLIQDNVPINDVIMSATSYQAAKHAELLFKYQKQPPAMKRNVHWYYGPTGTGKTRQAVEKSGEDYYITMNTLKWWDGYVGQKNVIVDDFRKDFCTFHELLRILDRYPLKVNVKGSSIWLQPTTTDIYITTCFHPEQIYETREDVKQLTRRIDEIVYFPEKDIKEPTSVQLCAFE